MDMRKFIKTLKPVTKPRPYQNHSVSFKGDYSAEQRTAMLEKVGLNVFYCPSEMITGCDMLSDSGTTTMTDEQWSALLKGDEAYGSNKGYFLLKKQIGKVFGEKFTKHSYFFHQGRACEDALFGQLGRLGGKMVIPSNGHFDTTHANIEANGITALNLFSPTLQNGKDNFRGNMDVERFKKLDKTNVPLAYITITNNTGGGQPVSMKNIREVSRIAHDNKIPLFLDACRFAENAWFIKKFEKGYARKKIIEIVHEMFSYADGFTISFKKDGLSNMGGGLFLREGGLFLKKYPHMPDALMNHQIIKEGHPTYGGMSGRDIMTLVEGLKIVVKEQYLTYRIEQVRKFADMMKEAGLPVLHPAGGHAVYLDMSKFFKGHKGEFPGISFTALLLAGYGHRACELGHFAFGKYENGKEIKPEVNFVRFAVPRLRYEERDLRSVVESCKALYDMRHEIPDVKVEYGRELPLRHFKARFKFA